MNTNCSALSGNAVKHFEAERREPSGESMKQTHRSARALPLQTQRFAGEKMLHSVAFQGLNNPVNLLPMALPWADILMAPWAESQRFEAHLEHPYGLPLF